MIYKIQEYILKNIYSCKKKRKQSSMTYFHHHFSFFSSHIVFIRVFVSLLQFYYKGISILLKRKSTPEILGMVLLRRMFNKYLSKYQQCQLIYINIIY